jgi:hypothetical protein
MSNIIGWFKGLAFVLTNAGEFARQQQEVATLTKRIEELEAANKSDTLSLDKKYLVTGTAFKTAVDALVEEYVSDNIQDAIAECDMTDAISDALDDAISNRDWDYELREAIDWDKTAEKVADKLDWPTIISDNEIVCSGDYDFDDMMLKSDHMSEDDLVTRADLSDMVGDELKRDWYDSKLKEDIARIFKDTLYAARDNEEENCRNAIDDEIAAKVDELIREQFKIKFGQDYDRWFDGFVRHAVKHSLAELLEQSYKAAVANAQEDNQS